MKYAFIKAHRSLFSVRALCRVLKTHHRGFYAWLKSPLSRRAKDDLRITGLIKRAWLESGCVYGYRKLHDDLRSLGETCCPNRVARLAKEAGIKAQIGYRRLGTYGGKHAIVADNQLRQVFDTASPDQVWVTDITCIRTHEGWLYLAVVIVLYARRVVGWSIQSLMHMELVLSAMLMAVWRRKPTSKVIVHSDQGSQYTSYDWQEFLATHNLEQSMSRRGNCYDNRVAESFFQLLKENGSDAKPIRPARRHAQTCSITSSFSIVQNASMVTTECRRQSISNGSENGNPSVSKKLGAIHGVKPLLSGLS